MQNYVANLMKEIKSMIEKVKWCNSGMSES